VSAAFLTVVCGLGVAHLATYYGGMRPVAGLLKGLPILILAWTVYAVADANAPAYARLVALGLVLSAVGDVCLVFAGGFLAGLGAFLLAHCCYIAAFALGTLPTRQSVLVAGGLAVVALAMLRYLWPHVARLRVPVTIYVTALSLMAWCAAARAMGPGAGMPATAAAIGALTFLVSDGVLAVDRFAHRFAGAHAVVMVTYYAAQILIARSALGA
jgi:uncharacterized membrane protein YhhN